MAGKYGRCEACDGRAYLTQYRDGRYLCSACRDHMDKYGGPLRAPEVRRSLIEG